MKEELLFLLEKAIALYNSEQPDATAHLHYWDVMEHVNADSDESIKMAIIEILEAKKRIKKK